LHAIYLLCCGIEEEEPSWTEDMPFAGIRANEVEEEGERKHEISKVV
jgi:hypothetical protein